MGVLDEKEFRLAQKRMAQQKKNLAEVERMLKIVPADQAHVRSHYTNKAERIRGSILACEAMISYLSGKK